ncbi:MAG: M48 family metallopeptidase, partial [Deltaproteobacteria bacterium]|nr:M48 family metallopeptidase [Deltaproteobacteria bacterium]
VSERPNMPYRFALYESEVPNALSLPDGSVFVSLGMASQCEGDDQIAAILAHEIAHVSCKHSLKAYDRLLTVQALSTITQIALIASGQSQASVDWAGLGSSLAGQLIDKGYTRTQEHEADQVGAVYLAKAGYDPLAMVDVFARIEELQGNRGSGFNKTHPFPKDRIKQVGLFVDAGLPDEQGKSIVVAAKDREPRMHSVAMQTMTVVEETSVGRDPASWKSLTPGKSTLDEAIQALGTPVSRDESGPGLARARFGDAGKEVVISTDENVIEIIEVMPDVMMSASDLEAAFGKPERESRNDDFIRLWHYGDGRTFVFRKDIRTVDRIIYADL